jgi:hypothetical protein
MKRYSIYLRIEEFSSEGEMEKQFKKQKKIFLAGIANVIAEKKIIIAKKQETLLAVNLTLDEQHQDELLDLFRSNPVIDVIDAEYIGPKEEE